MNRILPFALSLLLSLPLSGCMTREKKIGGIASLVLDPARAVKAEPPPTPPNSHMPPVYIKPGALSLQWVEDLTKTATNDEPDPDAGKKRPVNRPTRKRKG